MQADKNYKYTGTQQMHTHAEVAEGCNIILYHNYGTERGPSKTSTVARLVNAFSFRTGPFMFSDSPSYLLAWSLPSVCNNSYRYVHTQVYLPQNSKVLDPW